jgi:hypothetical protein
MTAPAQAAAAAAVDGAAPTTFSQRVRHIDQALDTFKLETANLPTSLMAECGLQGKVLAFPDLSVAGGADDTRKNDMYAKAHAFVVCVSEMFTSLTAIQNAERFSVRELMECSTRIQLVFTAGRHPTLICSGLKTSNRGLVKVANKVMTLRKADEYEELSGLRISPTRAQWQALLDSGVMQSVFHGVRKAHAREDVLQINVDLFTENAAFWQQLKDLQIPCMQLENVCSDVNKELMCSVRAKRGSNATVSDFISTLAVMDQVEMWHQSSGTLRIKAPTKEVLRLIVDTATDCGLNVFTDTPRRWMDVDHVVGYRALPDASATPSANDVVVIKSSVPTKAARMQAALATIGFELDPAKWDSIKAGIKKKTEGSVLPVLPYVFGPEHKGLILDYEGRF